MGQPEATYETIEDALEVAAANTEGCLELARRGPGHMRVAEVVAAAGAHRLRAVYVQPEPGWRKDPSQHVVERVDGRTGPLCGRTMTDEGTWQTYTAGGHLVGGLDPENCAACHDTMTTHGISPLRVEGDRGISIPPPE